MLTIGCHLSLSKGYAEMGADAIKIGANTFQFFTRNPRGGAAKEINDDDVKALTSLMEKYQIGPVLAHASYTLNLCSADPVTRQNAFRMMTDDLNRLNKLPCHLYNFHPGSFTTQTLETAISQIIDALNRVIKPDQNTFILLETMAGKGTEVGRTFEELRRIIDELDYPEKIGVCIDTCHLYDAGYDVVNDLDGVFSQFDKVIGLEKIKAVHLNDSMNPKESHKDRHQKIGEGSLGIEAITRIINHPVLRTLPFFLETPNDLDGHANEIKWLKSLYKG